MYTFGILALFFILLSGAIFGKKIKQNQFAVVLLVLAGTLIGSTIVNGVMGLKIPLTFVEVKTKHLDKEVSKIQTGSDTLEFTAYLDYTYIVNKKDSTDVDYNYVDINLWNDVYSTETDILTIEFLPEGDSIPYVKVLREKRIVDNKWITPFGLPKGVKNYVAYIPNDSIHNVLMDQLNEKFFKDEKEELAKLD